MTRCDWLILLVSVAGLVDLACSQKAQIKILGTEPKDVCEGQHLKSEKLGIPAYRKGDKIPSPCPIGIAGWKDQLVSNTTMVGVRRMDSHRYQRRPVEERQVAFFGKGPMEVTVKAQCRDGLHDRFKVIRGPLIFHVYQCLRIKQERILQKSDDTISCVGSGFQPDKAEAAWVVPTFIEANVTRSGSSLHFPEGFTEAYNGRYTCTAVLPHPLYFKVISVYDLKAMAPPKPVSNVHNSRWSVNFGDQRDHFTGNVSVYWTDNNGKLEGGLLQTEVEWKALSGDQWTTVNATVGGRYISGTVDLEDVDYRKSYTVKITPITPYGRAETFFRIVPSFTLEEKSVTNERMKKR